MPKLTFYKPPDIQKGYIFNPQRSFFSVVVPEETTNLIYNPETQHLNDISVVGSGSTIELDLEQVLFGVSSAYADLFINGYINYEVSPVLVPNTVYTFSVYTIGTGQIRLEVYNETSSSILVTGRVINNQPDLWTRQILTFTTPDPGVMNTTTLRIVNLGNHAQVWFSGLQLEQKKYATTFCSGNLTGLITGESPKPYFWAATPNYSPSIRLNTTRDGGKIVSLETLGFHVTGFNGFGLPQFDTVNTPIANGMGSVYQGSTIEKRDIEICGILMSPTIQEFFSNRGMLTHVMQPMSSGTTQPLKLIYSVYECTEQICEQIEILATYESGLEGDIQSLLGEEICIDFSMLDPLFKRLGNNAKTLNVFQEVTDQNDPVGINNNGEWDVMEGATDLFGDVGVYSELTIGPDNNLYVGSSTNGSSGNYTAIARWNGVSWDSVGKTYETDGITLTDGTSVEVILSGTDGCLYVGGNFSAIGNSNGVVNVYDGDAIGETTILTVDSRLNIARYRIATNTWEYIGRFVGTLGLSTNIVMDMKLMQDGKIWIVGNFSFPQDHAIDGTIFGLARNIIEFNPVNDAMSYAIKGGHNNTLGTDPTDIIYTIEQTPNGRVWIGGDFTFDGNIDAGGGSHLSINNVAVFGKWIDSMTDTYLGFEGATGTLTNGNIIGGPVYVIKASQTGEVYIGGAFDASQIYADINATTYPPYIQVSDTTELFASAAFGFAQYIDNGGTASWSSPFILGAKGFTSGDPDRLGIVHDMAFDIDGHLHIVGLFTYANTTLPNHDYLSELPLADGQWDVVSALATQTNNCNGYIIWDGSNFIQPDILFSNEVGIGEDPGDPRTILTIELGALYSNRFSDHSNAPFPGEFQYSLPGTGGANINPGFEGSIFLAPQLRYNYVAKDIIFVDLECNDFSKPIFVINGPGLLKSIINETTRASIYFNYQMSLGESLVLDLTQPLFKLTSNIRGNLRGIIRPNSTISSFVLNTGVVGISVNLDLTSIDDDTQVSYMKWRTCYWSLDKACAGGDCGSLGTYNEQY